LSQNPCNEDAMAQNGAEMPLKMKKTRKQMFQHVWISWLYLTIWKSVPVLLPPAIFYI